MMREGSASLTGFWLLTAMLAWQGIGSLTSGADPWDSRGAQPLYVMQQPGFADSSASFSAPLRIARPFDSGPQVGRSQLVPPAIDILDAPQYGPPGMGVPYGLQPVTPDFYVDPSLPPPAYEFDSFDGSLFGYQSRPDPYGCEWLYPFANGHATWVQGQGDSLGFTELDRRFLLTNPLIAPFRIIPGFMTRYVSGPDTTDLPPYLIELSMEVAATYQLEDDWVLDVGIRPGLNGDFEFVNNDTFRMQGHAVASRPLSMTTQGVLGFVYLDREDIPALPVAGLIWRPNPDVQWDLVFPRPRLATRIGGGPNNNGWLYVKGELGGNSWSIERATGQRDVTTYRDLRMILGYETLLPSGIAVQFEGGWVFSRKLMYESGGPDFRPNDTFLLRAGMNF